MAMIFCNTLYSSSSSSPSLSPLTSSTRTKPSRLSKKLKARAQFQSMEDHNDLLRRKFMEFRHVDGGRLPPVSAPPLHPPAGCTELLFISDPARNHLRYYQMSLFLTIDFVIGSWIHCKIPTGVSLNITSISGFLSSSTKAPNFVFELIQSSPKSIVLILDLLHRKDLVLHPDYLNVYYQDTSLDTHRQSLLKLPEIKPYVSPSLFVRAAVSPTTSTLKIDVEEEEKLDEILRDHVSPGFG
ncbi:unnamed protein product [Arabis nemorensis]|uniref:Red chlorophyll catabolite reductase n=1 Tax=Arabis nemorensis TaxID=586526 RepID=A0A565C8Q2_9BRAS|nr:unnamed protein product [Arabis nemorensis]